MSSNNSDQTDSRPTVEFLVDKYAEKAYEIGRNNAGFQLAVQLRDNSYSLSQALAAAEEYAAAVGPGYSLAEATASAKSAYRSAAREPWSDGKLSYKGRQAALKRNFPTESWQEREVARRAAESAKEQDAARGRAIKFFFNDCKPIAGTPAAAYLESRGIPTDLAQYADCRYAEAFPNIGEAVVFKVRDDTRILALQGRSLSGKVMRNYCSLAGGVFSSCGVANSQEVAITESPIDALSLAAAGLPAVALCGTGNIPKFLVDMLSVPAESAADEADRRLVFLATDNDEAGEQAATRLASTLSRSECVRLNPTGKDFNDDWLADPQALAARVSQVKNQRPPAGGSSEQADSPAPVSRSLRCPKCGTANNVKPTEFANISSYKCACGYDCAMDNILLRMDGDKIFAHTKPEDESEDYVIL